MEIQAKFEDISGASSPRSFAKMIDSCPAESSNVRSHQRDSTQSATRLQPKRQEGRQAILRIDWQTGWPTFANEPARISARVRKSKSLKDTFRADNYMATASPRSRSGARARLISRFQARKEERNCSREMAAFFFCQITWSREPGRQAWRLVKTMIKRRDVRAIAFHLPGGIYIFIDTARQRKQYTGF